MAPGLEAAHRGKNTTEALRRTAAASNSPTEEVLMTNPIRLTVDLSLPDDGPTLSAIDALARRLNITRDEFITRAVILYADEVEQQLQDPRVIRQFDAPGDPEPW
jgi:hypothetical protein